MNDLLKDYKPEVVQKPDDSPKLNQTAPEGEAMVGGNMGDQAELPVHHLYAYFNISEAQKLDRTKREKLSMIWDYAHQMGAKDQASVVAQVKKLEKKLKVPTLGVDRVNHIYQWVKLQKQIGGLKAKQKNFQ